ncbi:small G protein signaling modulator 1-like [Nycticebus coucang]|uniref:small G protein signaling modulator 1-like n=1 Tax=Nycticebus coucang TaxID=9470 RepID=UPI00234CFFBD|nr:small G protein signaling modulator 1-like isoform X2 [Nycticebus coucang]XP_053445380.1 small G protein signaling modulator 1-like [Nycticebus coucang]
MFQNLQEALAFSCFTELMKRMNQNFPHGGAMDTHFANMRSLIQEADAALSFFQQILHSELFELMHQNGDYTHFYFCYRWFLLDFKREMAERHNTKQVLKLARDLVYKVQTLIQNK